MAGVAGSRLVRVVFGVVAGCLAVGGAGTAAAQQGRVVELTFERMVELGLADSYRVRQLLLEVERTESLLQAEQAELKSRVDLRVATPNFEAISDEKWNPDLGRNEIVHTNTQLWQMDLSVRQPVILFGYPTNGNLSLNNRVYRYAQLDDEGGSSEDIRYYNRYYVAYEQPLFQPNRMKNELEEARLDLERAQLSYQGDVVNLLDDLAGDYFRLMESEYERRVAASRVAALDSAMAAARALAAADSTREIEVEQLQVELANAREATQQAASSLRLQTAEIKQRLRLPAADSLFIDPRLEVEPVSVDVEEAVELATSLAPRMRELEIQKRQNEIRLENTKGRDSFRLDLELSYGREMQDPRFQELWGQPENSYTLSLNGYVPIWDWGARSHRIQAEEYQLQRTELRAEEARTQIEVDVRNEVRNLAEYESRALAMQQNLRRASDLTASTIRRYEGGVVSLVDVLQAVNREADTAENFMDAYLGYRRALLRLQELTHFDFRTGLPVAERYGLRRMTEN